jgi:hypothetical protein
VNGYTENSEQAANYSDRVRCKSCENGSGPHGCTDCLNTGHDPMAFAGGVDEALNEAYAEGRKDEAESHSCAARDVLAERERQQSAEGWTPEHDDEHQEGELSAAAAAYAWAAGCNLDPHAVEHYEQGWAPPPVWPWDDEAWKPADVRRMLVKAGALILAEIERLDRASGGRPR